MITKKQGLFSFENKNWILGLVCVLMNYSRLLFVRTICSSCRVGGGCSSASNSSYFLRKKGTAERAALAGYAFKDSVAQWRE